MGNSNLALAAGPGPLNFTSHWSQGFVVSGEENPGQLQLVNTSSDQEIQLTPGQQIAFLDLPGGWSIAPSSTEWQASTISFRGAEVPALTYLGAKVLSMMSVVHALRSDGAEIEMAHTAPPLDVPVKIGVPKDAPDMIRLELRLFGSDEWISNPSSLILSSIAPDAPFVAYADPPAVVLLTAPGETSFANSVSVTLCNLRDEDGSNVAATLSLAAQDENGQPVAIGDALDGVTVEGGGADWTYNQGPHDWSTTIPTIPGEGTVPIKLSGLALPYPDIALVTATLTLNPAGGDSYQTIAWFQSYGPFVLTLELSPTEHDSIFYRLSKNAAASYAVNTLNRTMNSPPLQANLLSDGNVIYPPVPGWYSWQPNEYDFPSEHSLSVGGNTVYYIVRVGETFMPVTTATIDYNFSPQQIQAAGYQQTYGDPNNPQFGPIMPRGAIILWNGAVGSIPAGWALCNGANGTPNLESKFVIGAGNSEVPNTAGGATAHNHNFNFSGGYTTAAGGSHTHAMPSTWYSRGMSCGGHPSIDTNWTDVASTRIPEDGSHTHTVTIAINQNTADVVAPRPAWYALCYIMKL